MSFRPSHLERSRCKLDEVCDFVDALAELGDSVTRCVKAWRKVVVVATGAVTSVIALPHLLDLVHLVLR